MAGAFAFEQPILHTELPNVTLPPMGSYMMTGGDGGYRNVYM